MGSLPGAINDAYASVGDNEKRIWKMLAYVGRYGHQPVDVAARLPMRQLRLLASALDAIVSEENGPAHQT